MAQKEAPGQVAVCVTGLRSESTELRSPCSCLAWPRLCQLHLACSSDAYLHRASFVKYTFMNVVIQPVETGMFITLNSMAQHF